MYTIIQKLLTVDKKLAQKVYAALVLEIEDKSDLLKHLLSIKKKLKEKGIKIGKRIDDNRGSYGVVFSTPEAATVMKITTDKVEAETSAKIKDKKFKHIVSIDKVFKLKDIDGVYFIKQEKLSKIDRSSASMINRLPMPSSNNMPYYKRLSDHYKKAGNLKNLIAHGIILIPDEDDIKKKQKMIDTIWPNILKTPLTAGFFLWLTEKWPAKKIFQLFPKTDKGINILNEALEGLDEMYTKGISYHDTHAGNLMQNDKGVLKWIDIGHGSKAIGKGKVDVIAKKKKQSQTQ